MTSNQELFRAVLDTNVLVPASLRDTLLRAAEVGLYEPLWTVQILEELRRTLVSNDLTTPEGADRLMAAMQASFPAGHVYGHEPLINQMPNDPKDRHVLAAAVSSGASIIVTLNLRHFRANELSPFSIAAETPETFLSMLFDRNPSDIMTILTDQAASLRRQRSIDDVLARISHYAPSFAERVISYRKDSTP